MNPREKLPEPPPLGVSVPLGADELPCDDGEPLETARHRDAMSLLIETLRLYWADRDDVYVGGNMFLYFSMTQSKRNDFRGPDFFLVLGTDGRRDRKSWVLWEEDGKRPSVIIELTSESTRAEDYGRKKDVYGRALEVPYYVIADPWTGQVDAFRLARPGEYEALRPNAAGRLPIDLIGLELGVWEGEYLGYPAPWLRWFLPDGTLLPTGAEHARAAEARADEAEARAEEAERRIAELERRLGERERSGPDPGAQKR